MPNAQFPLYYLDQSPSRSYTSEVWLEILTFLLQNMSPVVKIIQPSGILDGTKASQFRLEISDLVEAGADVVLIDFQDVTFMDSSGLGALVLALKTVRAAGSQLVVCSINEQIRILFELTSMDRVFEIFATREAFNSKILL
jgi:anti-sigma B factor antagonist